MKKVTAVLLGAGARGTIYARYALEKPKEFEIVARRGKASGLCPDIWCSR